MKLYLLEKLSDINYRMSVHQGDANQRLASEAKKLLLIPIKEIPDKYLDDFKDLLEKVNNTIRGQNNSGLTLVRISGIKNVTASKYIKLLIDIEEYLKGTL